MPGVKAKHFRRPGGVVALPRELLRSPAYLSLSLAARCLIVALQCAWSPSRPVIHYSTRRAAEVLNVSQPTACRAFKELRKFGFIEIVSESNWLNGEARVYRLTWLSANGREPTDEWRNAPAQKNFCDSPGKRLSTEPIHRESGQAETDAQR